MPVYRLQGEVEVYTHPFDPYWRYQGPRRLTIDVFEVAEDRSEAMQRVSTWVSSLYSDDWLWVWWEAIPDPE